MANRDCVLVIDQGTTSTRCIVFARGVEPVVVRQRELAQHFPADGWVEHDAIEILDAVREVCRSAIRDLPGGVERLAGVGITNQRETTVVWNRATGVPIYRAIVWQDRRTAEFCRRHQQAGHEALVQERTGLLIDPYFSAGKVRWLLDHVEDAASSARAGDLAFGTIDSWLIWNLTGRAVHATDATNASRTLLFDIHTQRWDEELLALFDIPASMLPDVRDSADDFGVADFGNGVRLPIAGVAGDQQAALFGQACFHPGMVKSTYGTGCFALMNVGSRAVKSRNRLLTTVGYRLDGRVQYALEGSIFVAGAAVQWLRDYLGVIGSAAETEGLSRGLESNRGVYLVPAFTGLGAPYWEPDVRGALFGLTRDTDRATIVRAALEAVCYQTRDLFRAMAEDAGERPDRLRVDGGMVVNDWLMQTLSDLVDVPVERPTTAEATALGAARLAGLRLGLFDGLDEIEAAWRLGRRFVPAIDRALRRRMLDGWEHAMQRVRLPRQRAGDPHANG
jgi:glycerol kinase